MVQEFAGVRAVTHTGSTAGYRAFLGRYPEQGLSVAMLCNASNVSTGASGNAIARAFLGDMAHDPPTPPAMSVDRADRFAGLFRDPDTGETRTLRAEGGVLLDGRTRLDPLAERTFEAGLSGRRYAFDADLDGFALEDWQYTRQVYERVEPWTPTAAELRAFVGTFHSDDAETTYVITTEGTNLVVWQRPNDTRTFRPIYRDGFQSGGYIIRFRRAPDGSVNALSLSLGRVYDMRFDRVVDR